MTTRSSGVGRSGGRGARCQQVNLPKPAPADAKTANPGSWRWHTSTRGLVEGAAGQTGAETWPGATSAKKPEGHHSSPRESICATAKFCFPKPVTSYVCGRHYNIAQESAVSNLAPAGGTRGWLRPITHQEGAPGKPARTGVPRPPNLTGAGWRILAEGLESQRTLRSPTAAIGPRREHVSFSAAAGTLSA
jgi:hypothetical protein